MKKLLRFDALVDGDLKLFNHSHREPGKPKTYNQRQNSWDKSALLAFLRTRQTRIQLHLPNLAHQPFPYNV